MAQLINVANVNGIYQTIEIGDVTQAVVELSAVTIEKSADQEIWVSGPLEYTLTVRNIDNNEPGDPVTNVVVTDTIDLSIAQFEAGSLEITIDGVPVTDPDYSISENGLLTINLADLQPGSVAIITFRVTKTP